MQKPYIHVIWMIFGIFFIAILTLGLEIGDDSDCENGYSIITQNNTWICKQFNSTGNQQINITNNITNNYYYNDSIWNQTADFIYPSDLNKYIGIGTTTPSQLLDVNGNIRSIYNVSAQKFVENGTELSAKYQAKMVSTSMQFACFNGGCGFRAVSS